MFTDSMYEIQIPSGVQVRVSEDGSEVEVKGKLGSATKRINVTLLSVKVSDQKLTIDVTKNKKLAKKAALATKAMDTEMKSVIDGVEKGIEKHMKVLFAHFPITIEVKKDLVLIKNIFGEKRPREARIIGDTKVDVKGTELFIKGVDPYDVGQTVANIYKRSFSRNKDSRVFQDGIYVVEE